LARYARKSIKSSKDTDHTLVFKKNKLEPKNGSLSNLQRIPNQNKHFVFIWTRRLAESVDALNSSLAQSAGE